MISRKFIISFFLTAFLVLTACSPDKIYEKHTRLDNLSWNRFREFVFEVAVEDLSAGYDFYIAIRHHTDIPYEELSINFAFRTPDGEYRSRDYDIRIKDRDGNLLGDGLGELWDLEVLLRKGFRFKAKGICRFEISNRMSRTETVGILEVGLIVRKSR